MTKVEKLERDLAALSEAELAGFSRWYAEFDAAVWDRRLAADVAGGAPDRFADGALAEHRAGQSRPI